MIYIFQWIVLITLVIYLLLLKSPRCRNCNSLNTEVKKKGKVKCYNCLYEDFYEGIKKD